MKIQKEISIGNFILCLTKITIEALQTSEDKLPQDLLLVLPKGNNKKIVDILESSAQ